MGAPDYIPPSNPLAKGKRKPVLEENLRYRIEDAAREQDFGRIELRIPELDMAVLKIRYPELRAGFADHETYNKAWDKFIASDESLPYRIRPKFIVR